MLPFLTWPANLPESHEGIAKPSVEQWMMDRITAFDKLVPDLSASAVEQKTSNKGGGTHTTSAKREQSAALAAVTTEQRSNAATAHQHAAVDTQDSHDVDVASFADAVADVSVPNTSCPLKKRFKNVVISKPL